MKKRIIIGMSLFSLIFVAGGIYLIVNIQMATATLDNLIKLHQVEIIREHLLLQLKRVQSDLYLRNTRYARDNSTIMTNVENMTAIANVCFRCHHSEPVMRNLVSLRNEIEVYKDALSRVITIRANNARVSMEEDAAFSIGEDLIARVNNIINFSQMKLEEKTQTSMIKIAQTKRILFLLVPLGPLLAIGLAFIFIRDITRPLGSILEATRSLKAGDLGYRIGDLRGEFGEVAASFNEMARSLNDQMRNMQRAEQMTVVGEMAASIAHEIKNPLAGIKIALSMLIENKNLSEAENEITRSSFSQIKRVESLIKEILDFARPKEPQYALTDVNEVIDKTVSFIEAVSAQANSGAGVKVVKTLATDVPQLLVDPMQIQQVVMNIVLNAYDAMPEGGTLAVGSALTAGSFVVTISDTGSGIDPQIMGKLFKPFFTTKAKGTGLGLAIIKGIVERHGGTVDMQSTPGAGTSVTMALPVEQGNPAPPPGGRW
jgi:signal transduction histidine kinase